MFIKKVQELYNNFSDWLNDFSKLTINKLYVRNIDFYTENKAQNVFHLWQHSKQNA